MMIGYDLGLPVKQMLNQGGSQKLHKISGFTCRSKRVKVKTPATIYPLDSKWMESE